jgi:hypothetical protein
MPTLKSPSAPRLVSALGAACALTAVVAACSSSGPATSSPAASTQKAADQSSGRAVAPSSAVPPATAPVAGTSAPVSTTAGCATSPVAPGGGGQAGGSITVCPDAAPIGGVVHVTIEGCAPTGSGLPDVPAAALSFLGPDSWLGTNGGGGANVSFVPKTGHRATATFAIPATYTGGNENGPYPTLVTKPGRGYEFITDPAGECNVPFIVLPN